MRRRGFTVPCYREHSTRGARLAYKEFYNREWPHDDKYLRVLAKETREVYRSGGCQHLLTLMRESD
jgi:hypothetical protein